MAVAVQYCPEVQYGEGGISWGMIDFQSSFLVGGFS